MTAVTLFFWRTKVRVQYLTILDTKARIRVFSVLMDPFFERFRHMDNPTKRTKSAIVARSTRVWLHFNHGYTSVFIHQEQVLDFLICDDLGWGTLSTVVGYSVRFGLEWMLWINYVIFLLKLYFHLKLY